MNFQNQRAVGVNKTSALQLIQITLSLKTRELCHGGCLGANDGIYRYVWSRPSVKDCGWLTGRCIHQDAENLSAVASH